MPKPMIRIHDVENDTVLDREMTDAEYEAYLADAAALDELTTNAALRAEQKAGLLERLGITEEEAELLLS
jgi:hypothetical protein